MPSFKPVTAVLRALDVLAAVNRLGEASVSQIHREVGLSQATIVRMLETLQHAGFVAKHSERAVYLPTGKTLELSCGYDLHRRIGAIAAPILAELTREISWPSDVAVCDSGAMIVAQTSRNDVRLFYRRQPGYRAPVLGTSLGRAYLAFCADEERQRILSLAARSPDPWNDIARDPERMARLLEEVRRDGYAVMDEDYSRLIYDGIIWAVGVPVLVDGVAVAALNVTLLRDAIGRSDAIRRFLVPLKRTAARLAQTIGSKTDHQ